MKRLRLTRPEMETILRTSAADANWFACTADPKEVRRITKKGYVPTEGNLPGYVFFEIPANRVTIRTAKQPKRRQTVRRNGLFARKIPERNGKSAIKTADA